MIYASVKKIINFSTAKVILLCSSGYMNEELLKYMDDESLKSDHVSIPISPSFCVCTPRLATSMPLKVEMHYRNEE